MLQASAVGNLPSCRLEMGRTPNYSFVIVLVFIRFTHCNFYFYIVFVSQIVIILVFVLCGHWVCDGVCEFEMIVDCVLLHSC